MKRSLSRRLCWWHSGLFAAAIGISLFLAVREIRRESPPGTLIAGPSWRSAASTVMEAAVPFVILGTFSWWLIHRALAPVRRLTEAAEHIHEDSLHHRLPLPGTGDELDRLTSVLNDLTGRMETSFARVREFTLHASHELKTPLTILRSGFEQALGRPEVTEPLREQLVIWLDEVDRLNRIVSGLTLLTQADAGQSNLILETVALHDLMREAASEAEILGQAFSLTVTTTVEAPFLLRADRHRLRQLLLNLTDNAVKYNRQGGYIHYHLEKSGRTALLSVTSGGAGIPEEDLPLIFDRFFRGAATRGTAHNGAGLGLSICQWIAYAHGGEVTASSTPDRTVLTLHLPLPPTMLPPS